MVTACTRANYSRLHSVGSQSGVASGTLLICDLQVTVETPYSAVSIHVLVRMK